MTPLGAHLRAVRKARGETLAQAGERLDVIRGQSGGGLGWLFRREKGPDGSVSIGDLRMLAELYGVPLGSLLLLVAS